MFAPPVTSCPVFVEAVAYPRLSCSARGPNESVPAHPPLPTPANLPFHLSIGSQTSNRICESIVGAITPATRQKGGKLPMALVEPGGVNDPVVTASATVIVVLGSCRCARLVHADAGTVCADSCEASARTRRAAAGALTRAGDVMCPPYVAPGNWSGRLADLQANRQVRRHRGDSHAAAPVAAHLTLWGRFSGARSDATRDSRPIGAPAPTFAMLRTRSASHQDSNRSSTEIRQCLFLTPTPPRSWCPSHRPQARHLLTEYGASASPHPSCGQRVDGLPLALERLKTEPQQSTDGGHDGPEVQQDGASVQARRPVGHGWMAQRSTESRCQTSRIVTRRGTGASLRSAKPSACCRSTTRWNSCNPRRSVRSQIVRSGHQKMWTRLSKPE